MSAISSLSQLQTSTAYPLLQGRQAISPQPGATAPSAVVNLSAAGLASAFGANQAAIPTALRYKDLGAELLASLASGAATPVSDAAPPDLTDNRFALSVLTASGRKAELVLANAGEQLFVRADADPELSEEEREALAGLAKGFQDAIDGLALATPRIRLGELVRFNHPLLQSIDLRAQVSLPVLPPQQQSLELHIDANRRSFAVDGPNGAITLGIDTSRPELLGTQQQQSRAIDNYLKGFDQAVRRGHGDPQLATMFKDAFGDLSRTAGRDAPAGERKALSKVDRAVLTGMADFEAIINEPSRQDNPARLKEVTGFRYALSQATRIEEKDGRRSLAQVQTSQLKAQFHEPLVEGGTLAFDFRSETQNYRYHEIDDSASSSAALDYKDGRLQAARLEQSVSQSERVRKYVLGKMMSDTTMPEQHALVRDLVDALAPWQPSKELMGEERKEAYRQASLDALADEMDLLGTRFELSERDGRLLVQGSMSTG